MYGKISALPTTAGVALLPFADNGVLFIAAIVLVVSGLVVMTASTILARKSQAAN